MVVLFQIKFPHLSSSIALFAALVKMKVIFSLFIQKQHYVFVQCKVEF